MTEYKLVIVGAGGVGKSSLTIQFIQRVFVEDYDPTIEDSYRKHVTLDNETCVFEVLDTAAQEDYGAMRDGYLRTGQGFLIVYSITSRSSFDEVTVFHDQILSVKDEDKVPIVIIGNKSDLETARVITTREGENMAKSFGCPFFETSAKTLLNVDECIFQLAREIKADNQIRNQRSSVSSKTTQCSLL